MRKLSPTAINTFLRSPKAYYWRYLHNNTGIEPITLSVTNYHHDMLFGKVWAAFIYRFYKGSGEMENCNLAEAEWRNGTEGWVPEKDRNRLATALQTLMGHYYQTYSANDGVRLYSEYHVEDSYFHGYLDGLSKDGVVHEVKATSRAKSTAEQLWKVQNSIQAKLYAVLTKANGILIEFAYKDPPYTVWRAPLKPVTASMREQWEDELIETACAINSLGTQHSNFICHPDNCCLVTKYSCSMCPYQMLCDTGPREDLMVGFKPRQERMK